MSLSDIRGEPIQQRWQCCRQDDTLGGVRWSVCPEGTWFLVYHESGHHFRYEPAEPEPVLSGVLHGRFSADGGRTWSKFEKIDFQGIENDDFIWAIDDHFIRDGVIYMGAREVPLPEFWKGMRNLLVRSDDSGRTWRSPSCTSGSVWRVITAPRTPLMCAGCWKSRARCWPSFRATATETTSRKSATSATRWMERSSAPPPPCMKARSRFPNHEKGS